jgi:3-hydroxyisobutyrate dehydrogenase-like beta-hydroxyacid dehydrogenase
VVADARPVLEAYGSPVIHAGRLGCGQRLKLVNDAMFAANVGVVADAVRLGAVLGLDSEVVVSGLCAGSAGRLRPGHGVRRRIG